MIEDMLLEESGGTPGYPEPLQRAINTLILPILEDCRPDYDVLHAFGVAYWADQLSRNAVGVDRNVLITAAWGHDIGYWGKYSDKNGSYGNVAADKADHMIIGATMMRNILQFPQFELLNQEQKEKTVTLVGIHDKGETVQRSQIPEAMLLLEADTLGAIDVARGAPPTFKAMEAIDYVKNSVATRRERFTSEKAMSVYDGLVKNFARYILQRDTAQLSRHDIRGILHDFAIGSEDMFTGRRPICLILRGLPGSGKSTTAKALLEAAHVPITYLNPDELGLGFLPETRNQKYRILLDQAIRSLLLGKDVLWDQPWSILSGIDDTIFNLNYFLAQDWCRPVVTEISIPEAISSIRVDSRRQNGGHGPSYTSLQSLYAKYEDIKNLPGQVERLTFDGTMNTAQNIALKIQSILEL